MAGVRAARDPGRRRAVAVLVAVITLAAACGSTVQRRGPGINIARDGGSGQEGALSLGSTTLGPNGASGVTAGGSAAPGTAPRRGNVGVGGGGSESARPGATSPVAGATPDAPASGPGFTAKEVYIGVAYNSAFEKQAAAAGFSTNVGDQQAQATAVANDINKRGGIAGRKIVVVFYDTQGIQGNDKNAAAQAACVRFTEDRLVFAAMSAVSQISNDTLFTCLARRGAVSLGGVLGGGYDASAHLARFTPYLYLPAGPAIERMAPVWMQRLDANGYFSGWDTTTGQPAPGDAKIGLLYGSNGDTTGPVADALAQSVQAALERQGRKLAATFATTGDPNEMNQAVLRFRQAGVTHVIGDAALITFLPAAAAQNYRPRYGLASLSGPALISLVATPGQLNGALGVGFMPPQDVDNAHDPGDLSPEEKHCREVMQQAGQPTSSRLAWAVMALFCDGFNFLATAVNKGGLSAQGVRQGAAKLGSLAPVSTFAISFPGGRPDGVGAVRDLGYQSGCNCFVYLNDANQAM